jgi:hypothetical protein
MFKGIKTTLILALISGLAWPLYAANDAAYIQGMGPQTIESKLLPDKGLESKESYITIKREERYISFEDWINGKKYPVVIERVPEKQKLREDWERALGYDLFMPYFKVDDIKKNVETRSLITIKKIRGKAVIREDEAKYIFSVKF